MMPPLITEEKKRCKKYLSTDYTWFCVYQLWRVGADVGMEIICLLYVGQFTLQLIVAGYKRRHVLNPSSIFFGYNPLLMIVQEKENNDTKQTLAQEKLSHYYENIRSNVFSLLG